MLFKLVSFVVIVSIFYQANHPPVVKIVAPKPGLTFRWNTSLQYNISVSDKEDGDTRFGEIGANEVLLEVTYVKDTSAVQPSSDKLPLQLMISSNCMNCHTFDSRLIGPSFNEISAKYSNDAAIEKSLVARVREGSQGIWGDAVMPTHPELSEEETLKMVTWILNYSKQNNTSYYLGTEGSIRLKRPPAYGTRSAVVLTASYLDHNKASGQDRVFISVAD
jgi:cytochrome c